MKMLLNQSVRLAYSIIKHVSLSENIEPVNLFF